MPDKGIAQNRNNAPETESVQLTERAQLSLRNHGWTASRNVDGGSQPKNQNAKRGIISGWTKGSLLKNANFLESIDYQTMQEWYGNCFVFTLTVRDLPLPEVWRRWVRKFMKVINNRGAEAIYVLVEFQKRGVPHIHGMAWGREPEERLDILIRRWWLTITGAGRIAQDVKMATNVARWGKYLTWHDGRGMAHYQRSTVPNGWKGKSTGKMWHVWGKWATDDPVVLELVGGWRAYEEIRKRKMRAIENPSRKDDWRFYFGCRGKDETAILPLSATAHRFDGDEMVGIQLFVREPPQDREWMRGMIVDGEQLRRERHRHRRWVDALDACLRKPI